MGEGSKRCKLLGIRKLQAYAVQYGEYRQYFIVIANGV